MLEVRNIQTYYGNIQALKNVSLTINEGEIVTLIGANGAGKSTLLMTLCGSPQAHSGSIRYMGEELVGQQSSHIMRKSIAVVPEGSTLVLQAGKRTLSLRPDDLEHYKGERGRRGNKLPRGFQRVDALLVETPV